MDARSGDMPAVHDQLMTAAHAMSQTSIAFGFSWLVYWCEEGSVDHHVPEVGGRSATQP